MNSEDGRAPSDGDPRSASSTEYRIDARYDAFRQALQTEEAKSRLAEAYGCGEFTEEQLIRLLGRDDAEELIADVRSREK